MENENNYYRNQHYNEALHQLNGNYTVPSTDETQYHQHQNTSEHDINHYRVASRYEKECEILKDLKATKIIIEKLIVRHHCNDDNNQITLKKVRFAAPYITPKSPTTDINIQSNSQENTSKIIPRKYKKLTNLQKLTLDNIYAQNKFPSKEEYSNITITTGVSKIQASRYFYRLRRSEKSQTINRTLYQPNNI